jgi:hypothetical protein
MQAKCQLLGARRAPNPHILSDWTSERPLPDDALMIVARGDPTMLARIGVMRALQRNDVREFTDREDMHRGKRKLKRDE